MNKLSELQFKLVLDNQSQIKMDIEKNNNIKEKSEDAQFGDKFHCSNEPIICRKKYQVGILL